MTTNRVRLNRIVLIFVVIQQAFSNFAITSPATTAMQQKKNNKSPLTFEQLEEATSEKLDERKAKLRDEFLAGEIQRRGIAFKLDKKLRGCLKDKLNSFPLSRKILEEAAKKKGNASLPRPMTSCDRKKILIADFHSLDPKDEKRYSTSKVIFSDINDAMRIYPETIIESLGEEITEVEGSVVARDKAKKRNASIILWGVYSVRENEVYVKVYFEMIQEQEEIFLDEDGNSTMTGILPIREPPLNLKGGFKVEGQLIKNISYVALLTLGLARLDAEDYDGAIDRFTRALEKTTAPEKIVDLSDLYFYRAEAYEKQKKWNQVIADCSKALEHNPNFTLAYALRGLAYSEKGDIDQALADCTYPIEHEANNMAAAYEMRGHLYFLKEEYDQAIKDFTKALEIEPDANYSFSYRLKAYLRKRDWEGAFTSLAKLIQLEPDNALNYAALGGVYVGLRKYNLAIRAYTLAINLQSDIAEFYAGRAQANIYYKKLDSALDDCNQAITLNPRYILAHVICGDMYEEKGNLKLALDNYTEAINLEPDQMEFYITRARIYFQNGNLPLAIDDLTKVINKKPNSEEAYFYRAVTYWKLGSRKQAIADFAKAIDLEPDDADVYYARGQLYLENGEKEAAVSDLKKVVELAKDLTLRQKAEELLKQLH